MERKYASVFGSLARGAAVVLIALVLGWVFSLFINVGLDRALRGFVSDAVAGKSVSGSTQEKKAFQAIQEWVGDAGSEARSQALLYGTSTAGGWFAHTEKWPVPHLADPDVTVDAVRTALDTSGTTVDDPKLSEARDGLASLDSYRWRRYLNGSIQGYTFLLFFAGLVLLADQARRNFQRRGLLAGLPSSFDGSNPLADRPTLFIEKPVASAAEIAPYAGFLGRLESHLASRGRPDELVEILRDMAFAYQEAPNIEEPKRRLEEGVEQLAGELESEGAAVRYIAWAIPSVGFIGTIFGIGEALGGAHKVVQDVEQQEAVIQGITGSLGTAFDTTLVALLCSLVLMLVRHAVERAQESTLGAFSRMAREGMTRKLSGIAYEQLFRKLLEVQTSEILAILEDTYLQLEERRLAAQREYLDRFRTFRRGSGRTDGGNGVAEPASPPEGNPTPLVTAE